MLLGDACDQHLAQTLSLPFVAAVTPFVASVITFNMMWHVCLQLLRLVSHATG
jgi:hypothetical protein